MNATKILRSVGTALRGGGVTSNSWLNVQSNVSQVVVSNERAFPYQMDGDYLGEVKELRFEHVPDAVRLVQSFPQQ
jgi:diacylglycerol kinase family enzyme